MFKRQEKLPCNPLLSAPPPPPLPPPLPSKRTGNVLPTFIKNGCKIIEMWREALFKGLSFPQKKRARRVKEKEKER